MSRERAEADAFALGQQILTYIKVNGLKIKDVADKAEVHINTTYKCLHEGKGALWMFIALADAAGMVIEVMHPGPQQND